jgi:hypothetical protein
MRGKEINHEEKSFEVYFIGDIHVGAANHQKEAFAKAVKMISESGAYWIGMGDYIDAINHRDPRFNPREIDGSFTVADLDDLPRKQSESLIKTLMPIKSQCLGLLSGNHEDSYRKHNTFDVVSYLCEKLECDNLGSGLAFINIKLPNLIVVRICACHGKGGGGMREGYPINKAYDVFRYVVADVMVMGHVHHLMADRAMYVRYTNGVIQKNKAWRGVSGCFLTKGELDTDGYFEQSPGKESGIGMLRLTVDFVGQKTKSSLQTNLQKVYLD